MKATIDQIIEATGGKQSRDGQSVVIGYGSIGYLRLIPSAITRDGSEMPAAAIEGKLSRRNGHYQSELRNTLRAGGIEIR